ncbi:MAG: hypothetical protein LBN95_02995 [Prevotellaceae bacterium]|jgi:hypothetical protein|nr:hypothetical protein [Prevotellaceae bacterium]
MNTSKTLIKIAMVALLIINSLAAQGQAYNNKYYLSFWGAGGYASILHREIPYVQAQGGPGALLGVGFEYNHNRFVITFGAEFDWKNSTSKYLEHSIYVGKIYDSATGNLMINADGSPNPNLPAIGKPVLAGGFKDSEDPDGAPGFPDKFVMKYKFDKAKDVYNVGYVNIPLLMGAKFDNGFYFLLGGKFGLNMFAKAVSSTTDYATTAIYPEFIDEFGNMFEYSLASGISATDKTTFRLGYNIAASAEIGKTYFFNKKSRWQYRLALFADYGLLNVNLPNNVSYINTDGNFIGIQPGGDIDPKDVRLNSILTSYQAYNQQLDANGDLQPMLNSPRSVNPLLVGIKFTLLFDLGNKEPCNCLPEYKSKWTTSGRQRTSYIKKYRTPSSSMGYKK